MAFATAYPERHNNGSTYMLTGTWTGSLGDASGSVTGKGHCISARFDTNKASGGPSNAIVPQISNSSGTWTVTVPYSETVTAGTYSIVFR